MDDFNNQKILYSEIVQKPQFIIDDNRYIPEATVFYLYCNNLEYINDYLNSKFGGWLYKKYYSGGGLGDNGYRYKKTYFLNLPVPSYRKDNNYFISFNLDKKEIEYINNYLYSSIK